MDALLKKMAVWRKQQQDFVVTSFYKGDWAYSLSVDISYILEKQMEDTYVIQEKNLRCV